MVEFAGGSTASSLFGRFTILGKEFETYGKSIGSIEENANPDFLFFDIA